MPPRTTVITAAYDVETYLSEAIESVLAQTDPDFEYLVVDDGSTDGTARVARDFAARDARVRVLLRAHAGSSAARNAALREARGEFVAFCDGDDRWAPDFLRESLAALRAAPAAVGATFTAFTFIGEDGRPLGKTASAGAGDYGAEEVLAGNCPQGNGSCLVLRRSCFEEAGHFDESLHNCVDLDMWLRIGTVSSSPLFRFVERPLVQWRVRAGAISASAPRRVDGLTAVFERYGHLLTPQSRSRAYTWPALVAFEAGRDDTARRWLREVRDGDRFYFMRGQHGMVLGLFSLTGPRAGRVAYAAIRGAMRAARKPVARLRTVLATPDAGPTRSVRRRPA